MCVPEQLMNLHGQKLPGTPQGSLHLNFLVYAIAVKGLRSAQVQFAAYICHHQHGTIMPKHVALCTVHNLFKHLSKTHAGTHQPTGTASHVERSETCNTTAAKCTDFPDEIYKIHKCVSLTGNWTGSFDSAYKCTF